MKDFFDLSEYSRENIQKLLVGKTIVTMSSKIKQTINYKIEPGDSSFAYTLLLRDKEYNTELYEKLIFEISEELL
jgi:hypothetical protein